MMDTADTLPLVETDNTDGHSGGCVRADGAGGGLGGAAPARGAESPQAPPCGAGRQPTSQPHGLPERSEGIES